MIDSMRDQYSVNELCEALEASRSGYYAARDQKPPGPRQRENERLVQEMKAIHAHRHTRTYGSPRMTHELRKRGFCCGKNRVARLMRVEGLRVRSRKPFRPKTTRADHAAHPSPNLLGNAAAPESPGQQLVSDITYIPTREGWLYLALVLDLYSRAILGWRLADTMPASLVTGALERALATGLVCRGAIFHSDRGSQYSATETRQLLAHAGLHQSMSACGCCYDNAFAESIIASLKSDLLQDGQPFDTKAEAQRVIFDYIETFYNKRRRHSALEYQSPEKFLNNYFQNQKHHLN